MKFGVSFGDAPHTRSRDIVLTADRSGFDQVWSWDSPVIWQDWCSLVGWLVAQTSERLEFGTCVTNPRTRHAVVTASAFATLNQITGGRMICGIGRGDSAVRVLKQKPANLADVEEAVGLIRALAAGETVELDGVPTQMPWASGRLPIYVAGYGPKALRMAGRCADGVIFQVADPYFIQWGLEYVRAGAAEAGRSMDDIVIHCATATFVSDDLELARERTRWFPAIVGNHIADILRHNEGAEMPQELWEYVEGRTSYDYRDHAVPGAEHTQYVPDAIIDRFCVIGSEQDCERKILELAAIGVSEFNIYPKVETILEVIETYGASIAPRVRERVGAGAPAGA